MSVTQGSRQDTIDIPKPRGAVVRRREKATAVGAELHVLDQPPMPADDGELRTALDIPDADHSVHGSGGEEPVVRAECAIHLLMRAGTPHRLSVKPGGFLAEHATQFAGDTVPKPCRALERDGGDEAAVVTERGAMRVARVTAKISDLGAARHIPKARRLVTKGCPTICQELAPVRAEDNFVRPSLVEHLPDQLAVFRAPDTNDCVDLCARREGRPSGLNVADAGPDCRQRWQLSLRSAHPKPSVLDIRPGEQARAVGAEHRRVNIAGLMKNENLLARASIPDARRAVARGGGDAAPVRAER